MRFWMGSIPKLVDFDNEGSALRIHPHPYPLKLIKRSKSMEKGERNLAIKLYGYFVKLRSEVGGKEDRRETASNYHMKASLINEKTYSFPLDFHANECLSVIYSIS